MIKIVDNGNGMSPETLHRAFDYLFTTKPVGKGTGLGLSICRQIIEEKHNGKLRCHSEIAKGTTLIIQLPQYNKNFIYFIDAVPLPICPILFSKWY